MGEDLRPHHRWASSGVGASQRRGACDAGWQNTWRISDSRDVKTSGSQVQLIQRKELLHDRLVAFFHLSIRTEEQHAALVQKDHAIGKLPRQAHVMRHYNAGQ